jgi:hypothetical protein
LRELRESEEREERTAARQRRYSNQAPSLCEAAGTLGDHHVLASNSSSRLSLSSAFIAGSPLSVAWIPVTRAAPREIIDESCVVCVAISRSVL